MVAMFAAEQTEIKMIANLLYPVGELLPFNQGGCLLSSLNGIDIHRITLGRCRCLLARDVRSAPGLGIGFLVKRSRVGGFGRLGSCWCRILPKHLV